MPRSRPPQEVWLSLRLRILHRDRCQCVRCGAKVTERTAHIDHIEAGKRAGNTWANLRTLCRKCHVLRASNQHRGMIAEALADGIIPPDWRKLVWE